MALSGTDASRTAHVAAVDLGASSGRVMLGEVGPTTLTLESTARFPNEPVSLPDGLHWNLTELYLRSMEGVRAARAKVDTLASVAIDSWAVDYGLLTEGRLVGLPYHYRDETRCAVGPERVHQRVSREELYSRVGLQYLPFNTIYQLAADPFAQAADTMLMVPDLLGYWMTGRPVTERTNASTTALVSRGQWDHELVSRLGLPAGLFGELVDPGSVVGPITDLDGVPLTTVGSHDTASAIVGVPLEGERSAYISCGTWGLVGLELPEPIMTDAAREANFTNEGGVDDTARFLTNVMGTWLLSETLRTWERAGLPASLTDLIEDAVFVRDPVLFDVQDPRFLPPGDMPERIAAWCEEHDVAPPRTQPEVVRSILESMARAFVEAVETACRLAGRDVDVIHLVGGGSQNYLLCQIIATRAGRRVLAGPVEATALGNVLVQGRTVGVLDGDLSVLRDLVRRTHPPIEYHPER